MFRTHSATCIELAEFVEVAAVARPSARRATFLACLLCVLSEWADVMGPCAGTEFTARFVSPGIAFHAAPLAGHLGRLCIRCHPVVVCVIQASTFLLEGSVVGWIVVGNGRVALRSSRECCWHEQSTFYRVGP